MTMDPPPCLDWPTAGIRAGPDVPADRRVTRENWRRYPYSRWAFQHARELVPSRALPPAAITTPLRQAPAPLGDLIFAPEAGRETTVADYLAEACTDAMLVVRDGVVRFEHYANGMSPATPHMLFSITKSLIGLIAERLIARRRIDPLAPVGSMLPELAGSGFATVALRHLLDMTDGVAFDEDYADPKAQVHLYSATYWDPASGHGGVLSALPQLTARETEPGVAFRYRTPVADAVSHVLRRATGSCLRDLVAEHIWHPAGCADEAYMLLDTAGAEIGGTGINATLRDVGRIGAWLLAAGQRPLLHTVACGGDRALFARSPAGQVRPCGSYRSLWWIDHGDPPTLTANGVYGQRLWLCPAERVAIVTFASHPIASNGFTEAAHRGMFAAIVDALRRPVL